MGATSDGKVILEDFEEGKARQLWKKGQLDAGDYFPLENFGVPKVLTAILEIKGNIQGLPSGFDLIYQDLADRNMHVRFDLKVVPE